MKECRYIELFAGVGGFHVGLDRAGRGFFRCVMANQWEPGAKDQFAADIYRKRFPGETLINDDICRVSGDGLSADMIVMGTCCQDYSVANNKSRALGIEGKKGVLWWEVIRIISEMSEKPRYLLLENVDRMLISPSSQRGRDFALIIQSLVNLGYDMEWRIINASEYGMPQKRKRVFLFAFTRGEFDIESPDSLLYRDGILARAFPIKGDDCCGLWGLDRRRLDSDLVYLSDHFNEGNVTGHPFENAGVVVDGLVSTMKVVPDYHGTFITLGDLIVRGEEHSLVTDDFYLTYDDVERWRYAKGNKSFERTNKDGYTYTYNEGAMPFPDPLGSPARTLITSEVSTTPNRFTHIIRDPENGRLRRLIPLELERIQMFPDNHTEGTTDKKRGFLMGNALVCGIVERIGIELKRRICLESYEDNNAG